MEHMREIEAHWNWLPTFRAVAESESLTEAGRRLGVGPSSLSRTIRLLEQSLGRELFVRTNRSLRPSRDGEVLLAAVRDGMRAIHEGILRLQSPEPEGALRISCTGLYVDRLSPLLSDLCRRYPRLRPELSFTSTAEIGPALMRGDLDVAICVEPTVDESIAVERLDELSHGIYCAPGHPLFEQAAPDLERVLEWPFVGPPRAMARADHWPPAWSRSIEVRVEQVAQAVELCATGRYLAFLPHTSVTGRNLRRFALSEPVTTEVFALRRADVSEHHTARRVVQSFVERIRQGWDSDPAGTA
ncbi:MAG: LysR family transcriptional regulator [Planctomycetota bacterium]